MAKHERPYSDASVGIQPAGDEHFVLTLYVTKEQACDLAWQLEKKVLIPPNYPKNSVQGQCRELYEDIATRVRDVEELNLELERWPPSLAQ